MIFNSLTMVMITHYNKPFTSLGLLSMVLGLGHAMGMSWLWWDNDISWQLAEMTVCLLKLCIPVSVGK